MKKFCFMFALIAGLITFKCSYTKQIITPGMSQQAIHSVQRKNDQSSNNSILLATAISVTIYFGIYGLLEKKQKRK